MKDIDEMTPDGLHEMARFIVEDLYSRTIKAMEESLTVGNYFEAAAGIDRYKRIHKNRI